MRLERDWRWGLKTGDALATIYSLFAIVVFVVLSGSAMQDKGVTLGGVIVAYYAGGTLAGLIVGMLRPLAVTLTGAIIVGVIGFAVVSCGIGLVIFGWLNRWGPDEFMTIGLMALIFGGVFGAASWQRQRR